MRLLQKETAITLLLIVGLLFTCLSCSRTDTEKPTEPEYVITPEEESCMAQLSAIGGSFSTYVIFEKKYPAVVIDKKSGQDIIGTEVIKIFIKEGLLGPNPEQVAKIGVEKLFEQLGYNSYRSWNLTEEQWQKAEKFGTPDAPVIPSGKKDWWFFPLAWNTTSYKGKICYVSIGAGKHWLPEEEFKEYLKLAREWIEKE